MNNTYELKFCFDKNRKITKVATINALNKKDAENKLFSKFGDIFIISIEEKTKS